MPHQFITLFFQKLTNLLQSALQRLKKKPQKKELSESISEISFTSLGSKVYYQRDNKIYLGKELLIEPMKGMLRDEARFLKNSNLYEVLNATVINEAFNLSMQAANHDHTEYAKALYYWNTIFQKTINGLSK